MGMDEADDAYFEEMTSQTEKCDVVYEERQPPIPPDYSPRPLDDIIRNPDLLRAAGSGMERLYRYQAEVFDAITSGEDVVITAPTASGKTEAFLLPILDMILADRGARPSALFIYPTKALTADQVANVRRYTDACDLAIQVLDGSTTPRSRMSIVSDPPDIIATNFDMLAYHMPRRGRKQFSRWLAGMLKDIRIVVVDEAHTCTGFYGANVRWMLRRLLRINPEIQLVASSATLGDPKAFCTGLFPRPMLHIDGTGARGEAILRFLRPSGSNRRLMIDMVRQFGLRGYQSMAFSRSRREAEMLAVDGSDKRLDIEVHKSGMEKRYRERVEAGLRSGAVLAVSCTPTLELGINIGSMKSVSSDYVPRDRLVQRMGRAGRRGQKSFAYMMLDGLDPITSYYLRNPERHRTDRIMHVPGHDNELVDENQVLLTAMDAPLSGEEAARYGTIVKKLESEGLMNGTWCTLAGEERALRWLIRDIGDPVYLDAGRKIGFIEMPAAFTMLYPGAILFHQKVRYRVKSRVRGRNQKAVLVREHADNVTGPVVIKSHKIQGAISTKSCGGVRSTYCRIHITRMIASYAERPRSSDADGEVHSVTPPQYLETDTLGVVLELPDPGSVSPDALHSLEHLLVHAARMVIGAEGSEIDGTLGTGSIILYDNSMTGGNGLSKGIHDNLGAVLERAAEIVEQCDCREADGCPRCIHLLECSRSNLELSKQGAIDLLRRLRGVQGVERA